MRMVLDILSNRLRACLTACISIRRARAYRKMRRRKEPVVPLPIKSFGYALHKNPFFGSQPGAGEQDGGSLLTSGNRARLAGGGTQCSRSGRTIRRSICDRFFRAIRDQSIKRDLEPDMSTGHRLLERLPEFVLPISLNNKYGDEDERVRILRDSFERYCPSACIWVVTPGEQLQQVKQIIGATKTAYQFLRDEDVVKARFDSGWYRQQAVKMAMAEKVGTPYYLTLDSDMFLVRPPELADFYQNGKGKMHFEKHPVSSDIRLPWYNNTAAFLRLPRLREYIPTTPVLLSAEGMRRICARLGENWQDRLGAVSGPDFKWTEYCLYHYLMVELGLLGQLHLRVAEGPNPLCHTTDVYGIGLLLKSPGRKRPFLVVDSGAGIYPYYTRKALEKLQLL
jgi:hypothetical protein